ncbi:uncharacterized protein LOC116847324 isoform X2 [Odontomachus brunneus]|uniref:uncharacterized protein LOC116847324 isoform X2 n=1 Tax=Odontomachus brunneus TaxID=486640 RepID=UPI0013F19871|nr:uncharacterized protein LOC116847324 isoform X2 [Odontomachus brunneus]XP_032678122.1 uncharacterized protein LOC116847324 isoform X2 [Odontomachus brunneus]
MIPEGVQFRCTGGSGSGQAGSARRSVAKRGRSWFLGHFDLVAIMYQANLTLPALPTFVRFVVMKVKAKNLRAVLHSMSRDWASYCYLSARDRRSMFHYVKKGRRINVVYIAWMTLTIGAYILMPLGVAWLNDHPGNATDRRLPSEVFFPFPLEQSYAYEMIYVAQSIMAIISGTAIFSVDCFVCVVVFHACGQLDVLAATLERYDGTVEHERTGNARSHCCACLSCVVKRHVHIVNYMNVVEKSFDNFILCQLLSTTIILAIQGFQIVLFARDSNITGFITFLIYWITFTFYIFIYCYVGDCVIEKVTHECHYYSIFLSFAKFMLT